MIVCIQIVPLIFIQLQIYFIFPPNSSNDTLRFFQAKYFFFFKVKTVSKKPFMFPSEIFLIKNYRNFFTKLCHELYDSRSSQNLSFCILFWNTNIRSHETTKNSILYCPKDENKCSKFRGCFAKAKNLVTDFFLFFFWLLTLKVREDSIKQL